MILKRITRLTRVHRVVPPKPRSRRQLDGASTLFCGTIPGCLHLQEEIVVLQEDIEQAEAINRFDDLLPTVRRLLEIKPNDRRAKRLLKELKTYGKGGNMRLGGRRDQRFDAVGSTFSPTKAVLFVVIPLLLFGAVSWATVVYIRSNNQTNPTAKNPVDDSGDVSIVVADGSTTGTQPPGVKDPEYTTTPQGALKIHIDYPAAWRAGDSRPIVVLFHGGGWRAGSPENLKELAEFFVKLGMVTARPEYRIKQRHGTTPDKCVEDAKTAIRWIRSKYRDLGIDPQRIVAFGTSAGGHLAACTGTAIGGTKAERPNALILLAPHLNLAANVASIEKLGIDRQTANAISPSLHVDSNTPPTLIIHGSDDIIVKLPELQEFATKGNQLDVSVELLTILGARHGLGQLWTDTSQRRITAFLNSRFPPDNRPSDSGQTNKATPVEITNSIGMKLRLISAGEFQMGSPNSDRAANREKEQPRHLVKITKSFYMDIHEVTVGQFRRFVQAEKYRTEAERDGNGAWGYDATRRNLQGKPQYNWKNVGWQQQDNHPVVNVTWNDASAFCRWLSRKEGTTYRLPTEAEWEYSCRAGTSSPYSSGDDVASLQSIANIADSSFSQKIPSRPKSPQSWDDGYPFTAPVGSFQRNDWGLYDMHGNVREWCQDWYAPYGSKKVLSDPAGPAQGQSFADGPHHVLRGGAFGDQPGYVRSADRATYPPGVRILDIGFRVARSIDPAKRTTSQTPRFDPTQPPPAVAPFRDTDTTVELFNGHDLTGWSVGYLRYTKDKSPKRWVIDKTAEVLHSVGGDQDHLITDDQFENYTLDLEWRFTRGYKSGPNGTGVIVHSPGTSNELDPDGFEVDVRFAEISALIETRSKIMKSGGQGMMGTGCFLAYGESITNHSGSANGLIGKENRRHLDWLEPPKIASIYSWNRLSITAVGDQLLVRINGKLVNKAWNLSRHKGRICLRSQNAAVEFRNITLRQHSN